LTRTNSSFGSGRPSMAGSFKEEEFKNDQVISAMNNIGQ
jgi:hypothetical protein